GVGGRRPGGAGRVAARPRAGTLGDDGGGPALPASVRAGGGRRGTADGGGRGDPLALPADARAGRPARRAGALPPRGSLGAAEAGRVVREWAAGGPAAAGGGGAAALVGPGEPGAGAAR